MTDYSELKIKINPEIAEVLSDICFENFYCDGVVQAEESYEGDLVLVDTTEDTLKVYLNLDEYEKVFEQNADLRSQSLFENLHSLCSNVLSEQRELLKNRGFADEDLGSWDFELEKIENQDWSKKWKESWDVTKVSDRLSVVPSWIEYTPKDGEITITLDPGTAFGTGTHPTTQLCMRAIEKYMDEGARLADIGTGSGILAVCGIKFKADSAYGCDNDELVIQTAIDNAHMNNVGDKCVFEHKTADLLEEKFDFITANILHNVLAEIMGDLKKLMKDNAKLVLSGIMDEKKQVVLDAIEKHGLKLIEEMQQDVWVGLIVEKI